MPGAVELVSFGITICKDLLTYYDSWRDAKSEIKDTHAAIAALDKTLVLIASQIDNKHLSEGAGEDVQRSVQATEHDLRKLQKKLNFKNRVKTKADIR